MDSKICKYPTYCEHLEPWTRGCLFEPEKCERYQFLGKIVDEDHLEPAPFEQTIYKKIIVKALTPEAAPK